MWFYFSVHFFQRLFLMHLKFSLFSFLQCILLFHKQVNVTSDFPSPKIDSSLFTHHKGVRINIEWKKLTKLCTSRINELDHSREKEKSVSLNCLWRWVSIRIILTKWCIGTAVNVPNLPLIRPTISWTWLVSFWSINMQEIKSISHDSEMKNKTIIQNVRNQTLQYIYYSNVQYISEMIPIDDSTLKYNKTNSSCPT